MVRFERPSGVGVMRGLDALSKAVACGAALALICGAVAARTTARQPHYPPAQQVGAAQPPVVVRRSPETLGFVVTKFWHSMVEEPNCPDGMNLSMSEVILSQAAPAERARLQTPAAQTELKRRSMYNDQGKSICMNPESVQAPPLSLVHGSQTAPGLDLDGMGSMRVPSAKGCAHQDFADSSGKARIDNQLFRINGCIRGFRFGGVYHQGADAEMRNGSYAILLEVSGVDDRVNDPHVDVAVYSSLDPTPFSAKGVPLPNGSLTVHPDRRYWAKTSGRIVNGVLTTEPFDLVLAVPIATVKTEFTFREARIQLKLKPDGSAEGVLAGYYPIDSYYQNQVTYLGYKFFGDGAANAGGFTCTALHRALQQQADGLRDPRTGVCHGISTAMMVSAVPAFVQK